MREVIVHAEQGLAVGGPAETGYVKSVLPYIPGSTVRGALAATWIRDHGQPTPGNPRRAEFLDIFERNIFYGPLFQQGSALRPMSAVFCKYPADDACRAWGADAAVDSAPTSCPHCDGAVERGKGDFTGLVVHEVTRTALHPDGRAAEGQLFTRHELARGLEYRGRIVGDHPWLQDGHDVWLGGRTSTAGMATLRTKPITPPSPPPSRREDGALIVRFTSPALVVDDAGRPSLDAVPEILAALDVPGRRLQSWVRPSSVGGWHAASGMPKPTEIAIALGSVIVLAPDRAPAPERLTALARNGIGLRRVEGFGCVEINPAPWRPVVPAREDNAVEDKSLLAPLEQMGLLSDPTTLRWLLDTARRVLGHRQRGIEPDFESISTERVAIYLDDEQFNAVLRLLEDYGRLPAVIVLLRMRLEAMEDAQ